MGMHGVINGHRLIMEKGLNAVHPARRAPMGAHLVIQAVGRRSMAEEEARRGMDARAQFPRQPAEDDILRPDGGNPAAVRHNTLHKRPAHQVARSAAGEPLSARDMSPTRS